jgi:exonuclease VII large subunit
MQLTMMYERSLRTFLHTIVQKRQHLSLVENTMMGHFKTVFTHYRDLEKEFIRNVSTRLTAVGKRLDSFDQVLTLSNPEKRLKQGYSITRNKAGRVVKSISQVSEKEPISIQVADGTIQR